MPVDRYRYDPQTGTMYSIAGGAESPYEGDISYLLNGQYTLAKRQLVNVDNPFIREQLGGGDVFVTRTGYANGNVVVTLSSEITEGTLNASSQRLASYSILGNISVISESGQEHLLNMEAASVTGFGQRLITYTDADKIQRFESVKQGDDREAFLRELYGDTVKWATSAEYTASAIAGYIRNHGDRLIHEIQVAGGIRDASGTLQTTGSGIIRAIAQISKSGLTYRKDIFINAEGNIRSLYDT